MLSDIDEQLNYNNSIPINKQIEKYSNFPKFEAMS